MPPASFCALPTCLLHVFRLPEMHSRGRTHNCFTSQLLLMRNRRREEIRERHVGFFLYLLVLFVHSFLRLCSIQHSLSVFPLLYTTRVERVIEGKSNAEDANFDISKFALKIQNGNILLQGNPPPSLRNEMRGETFPCLCSYSFRFFFFFISSLLCLFSQCKWKANGKQEENDLVPRLSCT